MKIPRLGCQQSQTEGTHSFGPVMLPVRITTVIFTGCFVTLSDGECTRYSSQAIGNLGLAPIMSAIGIEISFDVGSVGIARVHRIARLMHRSWIKKQLKFLGQLKRK